jgi:hypothetical protein
MAGYSPNPLVKKLGIKEGFKILLVNPPDHYRTLVEQWPDDIAELELDDSTEADFIHCFTQEMGELEVLFPRLKSKLIKGGGLWISWPKGSSKLPKDLNGNDVRRIGLETGLVDVKVCAVDDDWSGLKFMYRTKNRK